MVLAGWGIELGLPYDRAPCIVSLTFHLSCFDGPVQPSLGLATPHPQCPAVTGSPRASGGDSHRILQYRTVRLRVRPDAQMSRRQTPL